MVEQRTLEFARGDLVITCLTPAMKSNFSFEVEVLNADN